MIHQRLLLCALLSPSGAAQDHWPQFRGTDGRGLVESTELSLRFDLEEDVRWRVELPAGSSSPCIWGDRLFVTGSSDDQLHMIAIDCRSGEELWRESRPKPDPGKRMHVDADTAAPTPCTDGERVIFYFGLFGLVALDLDGELLWEKPLPVPGAPFGIGTSPILVDDLVILSRDGCPDSGIHAYAKSSGEKRWSRPRVGYTYSFGTPFLWENSERRELVVAGTQRLSGLDPKSGEEFWQLAGLTSFVCTSPSADGDTLYFGAWSTSDANPEERNKVGWGSFEFSPEELDDAALALARLDANQDDRLAITEFPESRARDAFAFFDSNEDGFVDLDELRSAIQRPKGRGNNLLVAISAGGEGDIAQTHVNWKHRRGLPYVASPLLHRGRLYLAKAGGLLSCLDAENGDTHYGQERLGDGSEYYASPVGIGEHLLVCSSAGTIYVLEAGDEFKVLRAVELGEEIHATPAVAGKTLYLRTAQALWAFASK